jgi:hypothetical protein
MAVTRSVPVGKQFLVSEKRIARSILDPCWGLLRVCTSSFTRYGNLPVYTACRVAFARLSLALTFLEGCSLAIAPIGINLNLRHPQPFSTSLAVLIRTSYYIMLVMVLTMLPQYQISPKAWIQSHISSQLRCGFLCDTLLRKIEVLTPLTCSEAPKAYPEYHYLEYMLPHNCGIRYDLTIE